MIRRLLMGSARTPLAAADSSCPRRGEGDVGVSTPAALGGVHQLPQPLRPAAGAALSVLPRGNVPSTALARETPAPAAAAGGPGGPPVRGRILDGLRASRRHCLARWAQFNPAIPGRCPATVAGIAIIVMGLHFLGRFPDRPSATARPGSAVAKPVGLWGAYVMGLAFAFGCGRRRIGPVLARDPVRWRASETNAA